MRPRKYGKKDSAATEAEISKHQEDLFKLNELRNLREDVDWDQVARFEKALSDYQTESEASRKRREASSEERKRVVPGSHGMTLAGDLVVHGDAWEAPEPDDDDEDTPPPPEV